MNQRKRVDEKKERKSEILPSTQTEKDGWIEKNKEQIGSMKSKNEKKENWVDKQFCDFEWE